MADIGFPPFSASGPTGAGLSRVATGKDLAVDLALVLAVDCSSSVDAADFQLQMTGIAAALRTPQLLETILAGPNRRIVLSLVQWSDRNSQTTAVGWRILTDSADIESVAREIERAVRHWQPGGTGLAAAIGYSAGLLERLPLPATRRVIDVSGDGQDNEGGNAAQARNAALAMGITINGLPILSGSRHLEAYYRDEVTGGDGSFVLPVDDLRGFEEAMTRKLLREIGQAVS
jgi:hypothetical protein